MNPPSPRRRPLAHAGGPATTTGDAVLAPVLGRALGQRGDVDRLTHGFHAYPARMHPSVARALIERLGGSGRRLLDPFCGSGTVVVEGLVAGMRVMGVDLHPLALRVAAVRCERRGSRSRRLFSERLEEVAAASRERVRARTRAHAQIPRREVEWYEPHVLRELAGLWAEIEAVRNARDRMALEMVFSANLIKVSRQKADTSEARVEKRIAKGLATEWFVRKGHELADRWAELDEALPEGGKKPRLVQRDIRELPEVARACDLIVSSPPYGGTYDYARHHTRRIEWLGLDTRELERLELGARRNLARGRGALARWDREVGELLGAMARVVRREGLCVLLVGDASVGGRRVEADEHLGRLAPEAGLEVVASASAERPDWLGGKPRREHLIALVRR